MAETKLTVLGQEIVLDCTPSEERRLQDLATLLEARLPGFAGDADAAKRLILTALSLLDETQAAGAALARAHMEIERLNDLIAEANLDPQAHEAGAPIGEGFGRVAALQRSALC